MKDYGEDGLAIYEDGTRETQEEHNRLLEEEAARRGKDGEEEQKPYRGGSILGTQSAGCLSLSCPMGLVLGDRVDVFLGGVLLPG